MTIRAAAVAGSFYPDSPERLRGQVAHCLREASPRHPTAAAPKAVIAPHAGYVYSGPIAGTAFRQFEGIEERIARVVIIGPAHRVPVRGVALAGAEGFETPLGVVPVDEELTARVAELPGVVTDPVAHSAEHSLEVELPFLQVLLRDITILPLAVGWAEPELVADVLEAVWGGEETRVVVSSDLSHYRPYEEARQLDRAAAKQILELGPRLEPKQACGAAAVNGLLEVCGRRGLRPDLLDLRSSGDTAGDRAEVVGYGAFAFHEAA